jgi:hypothetical protein
MAGHEIPATPENMVASYPDATVKPVLTINSGDVVTPHSFPAGGEACLPRQADLIPANYRYALDAVEQGAGTHNVIRPIFARGAKTVRHAAG